MVADPLHSDSCLNRRTALLASLGLLALPHAGMAATPSHSSGVWPLQVPGGITRLSLGPQPVGPTPLRVMCLCWWWVT